MWARFVQFFLCQRMRRLRWQRFLTLSQRKKKLVSDHPEVHFFHWFKLDLVKMAKLACDELCQRMRRMRQHFASICGTCGSTLLAYAAHTLANCYHRRRILQQNRVKMSFCKRMLRMRLQIASVCCACGSKLLAYAAHTVATCQRRRRIRQQIASVCMRQHFASVDGACGSQNKRVYSENAYQR